MPSARRLSQTLGRASGFIMKAHPLFVALYALAREIPVVADASRLVRPVEVASRGRCGLPVLRRPAHGCIISQESAQILPIQASARSRSKNQTTSQLHCRKVGRASPFSRSPSTASIRVSVGQLAFPALVCFAIQTHGEAASPGARPNPSFKRTRLRRSA